jgi:hypothetical protein
VAGVIPPRPKIGAVEVAVVVGVAVVVNFKGVEVGAELASEIPDERDVPVAKIGINEDAEVVVVVLVPRLNWGVVAELAGVNAKFGVEVALAVVGTPKDTVGTVVLAVDPKKNPELLVGVPNKFACGLICCLASPEPPVAVVPVTALVVGNVGPNVVFGVPKLKDIVVIALTFKIYRLELVRIAV